MKHAPKLDPGFIPFGVWREAYLKDAKQPISIAVERDKGRVSVHHTCIHGTPEMAEADYRYVERYVKFLLWSTGGFRVSICGCSELAQEAAGREAEFVTLFYGEDVTEEQAAAAEEIFVQHCPGAEVSLLPGGQPVYYYIISIE